MQGERKGYRDCADHMVSGLMEVLSLAAAGYHSKLGPDAADMESLYEALRILRPNKVNLEIYDGLIKIKLGFIEEAIASLQQLIEKSDFAYAKGVLAYCLFMKGDASWNGLADEALAQDKSNGSIELLRLVKQVDASNRGVPLEEIWREPDSTKSVASSSLLAVNTNDQLACDKAQATHVVSSQEESSKRAAAPAPSPTQPLLKSSLPGHAPRF